MSAVLWLLAIMGSLVGLALLIGAIALWLTGRWDPPRGEE